MSRDLTRVLLRACPCTSLPTRHTHRCAQQEDWKDLGQDIDRGSLGHGFIDVLFFCFLCVWPIFDIVYELFLGSGKERWMLLPLQVIIKKKKITPYRLPRWLARWVPTGFSCSRLGRWVEGRPASPA